MSSIHHHLWHVNFVIPLWVEHVSSEVMKTSPSVANHVITCYWCVCGTLVCLANSYLKLLLWSMCDKCVCQCIYMYSCGKSCFHWASCFSLAQKWVFPPWYHRPVWIEAVCGFNFSAEVWSFLMLQCHRFSLVTYFARAEKINVKRGKILCITLKDQLTQPQ